MLIKKLLLLVALVVSIMSSTSVLFAQEPVLTRKAQAGDQFPRPFALQLDQQSPTSVSGTVADSTGQPIAKANVAIFVEHPDFLVPVLSPTLVHQTTTDEEGRFSM